MVDRQRRARRPSVITLNSQQRITNSSADNDSYFYAIAGRPFVRFDVHAFEKNVSCI